MAISHKQRAKNQRRRMARLRAGSLPEKTGDDPFSQFRDERTKEWRIWLHTFYYVRPDNGESAARCEFWQPLPWFMNTVPDFEHLTALYHIGALEHVHPQWQPSMCEALHALRFNRIHMRGYHPTIPTKVYAILLPTFPDQSVAMWCRDNRRRCKNEGIDYFKWLDDEFLFINPRRTDEDT